MAEDYLIQVYEHGKWNDYLHTPDINDGMACAWFHGYIGVRALDNKGNTAKENLITWELPQNKHMPEYAQTLIERASKEHWYI